MNALFLTKKLLTNPNQYLGFEFENGASGNREKLCKFFAAASPIAF